MVESRQKIIDIQDCEYDVFHGFNSSLLSSYLIEFLRYLYCKEVELDTEIAIKLLAFSDKYLQNDLNDKCMSFLKHRLNSKNVYTVLDFAREENHSSLANWCLKFLENNINIRNVKNFIQYLDKKSDPEFITEHLKLKRQAFDIILENYIDASQKQQENLKFYEDFLIKNIEIDTITSLANFLCDGNSKEINLDNLKRQVLNFADQNFKTLQEKNILKDIEKNFFIELVPYIQQKKSDHEDDKISLENEKKKGLKRREPSSNSENIPEENPLLKQTKKDLVDNQY